MQNQTKKFNVRPETNYCNYVAAMPFGIARQPVFHITPYRKNICSPQHRRFCLKNIYNNIPVRIVDDSFSKLDFVTPQ